MATYQFKTNIHCSGCIEKVTPFLQRIPTLESWEVNTENPDKILTVTGPKEAKINEAVTAQIKAAGYHIEPLV